MALSDIVLLLEDISVIMSTQGNQGNRLNLLESSVAEISISLGLLSSTVDDLELRVLALEQAGPPPAISVNFSGAFTHLAVADAEVQQAWQDFRNNATGSFQSIEIRNSLGGSVICSDSVVATQIANELNLFTHGPGFASFACGSQIWNVGTCGGIELNAGSVTGVCRCGQNAVVRPTIANDNWGGVSTEFGGSGGTCDAPSQTLEVILTR
ncbi:MAG: hypothetical protein GY806_07160 [Gammaproteobacteria bacterium]|nr:hypothetical protein [Gammaproteobacteria bacterium]